MSLGASPKTDAINARALNLTFGSGFAALVASGVTIFNKSVLDLFGKDLDPADLARYKVTLLVAVIGGFALVAVADILARSWVTAAEKGARASNDSYAVLAAPATLKAKKTEGTDVPGFTVAAIRFLPTKPDAIEYLLVKADTSSEWVSEKNVQLTAG